MKWRFDSGIGYFVGIRIGGMDAWMAFMWRNAVRAGSLMAAMVCAWPLVAQEKGEVRLHIAPYEGMQYLLNGVERGDARVLTLPPGDHRFAIWAPDRAIVDTTVTVVAGQALDLRKVLPMSPDYLAYRAARSKYNGRRLAWRGIPLLCTAVGGVFTVVSLNKQNTTYEALEAAEADYASLRDPAAIAKLKESIIPARLDDHKAARGQLLAAGTFTGLAVGATIYGFIRAAKLEKPAYEDREKVRFEGLAWQPGRAGGWCMSVTVPIR